MMNENASIVNQFLILVIPIFPLALSPDVK